MANIIRILKTTTLADGTTKTEVVMAHPHEGVSIEAGEVLAEWQKRELRIATSRRILRALGGWVN